MNDLTIPSVTLAPWTWLPLSVYLCWVCFVMMIAAKESRKRGRMTKFLLAMFSPFLLGLAVLDVGLQLTIANVLGAPREWTISSRMKRYRDDPNATRAQRWVSDRLCGGLLNPIDPEGHC